ncbi:hypothetical protein M404DRAFT_845945 [Pisolithus tinctorius Marx 270]|uniref:Uncharacterized protein n=1 Tax=Pisolithus tinctorius Marx 270 TaxID=870435 RepID=A0A0C3INW7_PISTI|nr:hypothetical protein M404DRAFT_845945 [Pisolithus tinctorius Marx 270]
MVCKAEGYLEVPRVGSYNRHHTLFARRRFVVPLAPLSGQRCQFNRTPVVRVSCYIVAIHLGWAVCTTTQSSLVRRNQIAARCPGHTVKDHVFPVHLVALLLRK